MRPRPPRPGGPCADRWAARKAAGSTGPVPPPIRRPRYGHGPAGGRPCRGGAAVTWDHRVDLLVPVAKIGRGERALVSKVGRDQPRRVGREQSTLQVGPVVVVVPAPRRVG